VTKHCKILLVVSSLFAASGIILASVGAHGAQQTLLANQLMETFNKAVDYSLYNALALLGLGVLCQLCVVSNIENKFHWPAYCIAVGGFIFQTSLFLYTLTGLSWATSFTPGGGMLMIIGWILLGVQVILIPRNQAAD